MAQSQGLPDRHHHSIQLFLARLSDRLVSICHHSDYNLVLIFIFIASVHQAQYLVVVDLQEMRNTTANMLARFNENTPTARTQEEQEYARSFRDELGRAIREVAGAERLLTSAYRIENPPLTIGQTRDANISRLHQTMMTLHGLYRLFMERIYTDEAFDEIREYRNLRDSVERCIYLLLWARGVLNLDAQLDLTMQRT